MGKKLFIGWKLEYSNEVILSSLSGILVFSNFKLFIKKKFLNIKILRANVVLFFLNEHIKLLKQIFLFETNAQKPVGLS